MTEESPFTPGRPVDAAAFKGREDLVHQLVDTACASCRGRFCISYISGERGIGKSSLAQMARQIAERDLKMATAYIPLGGVVDLKGLARLALKSIVQGNGSQPWIEKVMKLLGNRIKKVGAFGFDVELNMPDEDLQGVVDNFAHQMGSLLNKIGPDCKGLMLVLDDINGLAANPAFSNWLKSMMDGVATGATREPPVFLLFAGLEERRTQMISHNPSVARVFQPTLFVEPWTDEEAEDFFCSGFERGGVTLQNKALNSCVIFSGGLPMLAQEIGNAVWIRMTKKGEEHDLVALEGIRDAAQAIGRQYLEASVVKALRSKDYRAILHKIVSDLPIRGTFSRQQLNSIDLSDSEKKALNNFINRMRKLGAILPDEDSGRRGEYRFPSLLHRYYFMIATKENIDTDGD